MYYIISSKKELKSTLLRLIKKRTVNQICLINFNFYSTLIKYNLLRYFLKNQLIYLNYKILVELAREELTVTFVFKNWIITFFQKNY